MAALAAVLALPSAGLQAAQTMVGPPGILKIGVGAPMTGSDSVFGTELRNGVEQAVADYNATGGVLGRKLAVEVGDDAGDPKQGIAVAKRFAANYVRFVIGHFNSGVTLAASNFYADNDILAITPASTNPQITSRGYPLIFRTCGRDDEQPKVAAEFLAGLGKTKIAIVYDKSTYGKEMADATRKALSDRGIKEVLYEGVNKDEKDYSALVGKLKSSGADYLYFGGDGVAAGRIVAQMRARGLRTVLVGSSAIASNEFATAGGDAAEGSYMTFPIDPRSRPEAAKIVQEFKSRSIDPEAYTLYAYAAAQVIFQAMDKARSIDPKAVAEAIHSGMSFSTVLGTISYDAAGDVTRPDYGIVVWKKETDGKLDFDPIKPR
jgi:branched-chain amino acid transport system substrate-binding protein